MAFDPIQLQSFLNHCGDKSNLVLEDCTFFGKLTQLVILTYLVEIYALVEEFIDDVGGAIVSTDLAVCCESDHVGDVESAF